MGKWCLHASSFIFDRIIIKVVSNQKRHRSSDEFDFGPLVSMTHLYVFFCLFFWFVFFFVVVFFLMRFDLGTLYSGEQSLPLGYLFDISYKKVQYL